MLVTVTHPDTARAPVRVSGPGPVESHLQKKAPLRSNTMVETGNLLGEDNEPNIIEDEEEEGEEEDALNPHVKPEQVSQDPYADLDGAFGNYGDKVNQLQSAVSQVSIEGELKQEHQQKQALSRSEPEKNGSFQQSVSAFNQISQPGI